eukprot:gene10997-19667_t
MRLHAAPVKSVEPHNWGYDYATARRGFPSLTTCDKGFEGKGVAAKQRAHWGNPAAALDGVKSVRNIKAERLNGIVNQSITHDMRARIATMAAAQVFQSYVPADLYAMQITCVVYFNRQ